MERFCAEHGVRFDQCGKVVVATRETELERLAELERRGLTNGVRLERIGSRQLHDLEPHAHGIAALHVLDTGVVDFAEVCHTLARLANGRGADIRTGHCVLGLRPEVVETDRGDISAGVVVNCAGLHSDDLAGSSDVRIVPFRGEFHQLPAATRAHLVRTLIYPVPDPAFPFLGAHLTRGIHGIVHAGPNAVLALAREGYGWGVADAQHVRALLAFPGFRVLVRRYWRTGTRELVQSLSRRLLARELSRLVPEIDAHDLVPSPPGVRAQALDRHGNPRRLRHPRDRARRPRGQRALTGGHRIAQIGASIAHMVVRGWADVDGARRHP